MKKDFYTISKKISYICSNEYQYFFNKKNVSGIGLGYKIQNGFNTMEKCIKVFVSKKINSNKLSNIDIIPILYKGIKTDVVESGIVTATTLNKRVRPIPGGYSISPVDVEYSGTEGCLVTDGVYKFLLSNNHVLANRNVFPINKPIVQPSISDKGKTSEDVVAILSKFIPLEFSSFFKTKTNYADCAIGKLLDEKNANPEIALLGKLKGISNPVLDETVAKCGRTTEVTLGKITAINTTYTIHYGLKSAFFKNQIITTWMAESGDSGAVLLNNKKYVLGLLAGSSGLCTIYNNIHDVLNLLNIEIVID